MGECAVCGRPLPPVARACDACGAAIEPPRCHRHPDRAADAECLLCQRPVCARCRHGLASAPLCSDHADVRAYPGGWVEVYESPHEIHTHLLAEGLRGQGIEARVLSQKDHVYVVAVGGLSVLRIVVPAAAFAAARAALVGDLGVPLAPPPACPICAQPYVPGQRRCSGCGIVLTRR